MLFRVVRIALIGYVVLAIFLFFFQRDLLYPGKSRSSPGSPALGSADRRIELSLSGGDSEALFLSPRAAAKIPFPVMIHAHGNGQLVDDWVREFQDLRRRGVGVLLVEYPGFGRASGKPTEASVREAMVAAYDRVIELPDVDRDRVFAFGHSLGGGAVCLLARERPLKALLLYSTFESLRPFAHRFLMPSWLLRDVYDNAAAVAEFDGPVLVVHGRRDQVIPFWHSDALRESSDRVEFLEYDCGHLSWQPTRLSNDKDLVEFLHRHELIH